MYFVKLVAFLTSQLVLLMTVCSGVISLTVWGCVSVGSEGPGLWVLLACSSRWEIQMRARLVQEVFLAFIEYNWGAAGPSSLLSSGPAGVTGIVTQLCRRPRQMSASETELGDLASLVAKPEKRIRLRSVWHNMLKLLLQNGWDVISFALLIWRALWRGLIRRW